MVIADDGQLTMPYKFEQLDVWKLSLENNLKSQIVIPTTSINFLRKPSVGQAFSLTTFWRLIFGELKTRPTYTYAKNLIYKIKEEPLEYGDDNLI